MHPSQVLVFRALLRSSGQIIETHEALKRNHRYLVLSRGNEFLQRSFCTRQIFWVLGRRQIVRPCYRKEEQGGISEITNGWGSDHRTNPTFSV